MAEEEVDNHIGDDFDDSEEPEICEVSGILVADCVCPDCMQANDPYRSY